MRGRREIPTDTMSYAERYKIRETDVNSVYAFNLKKGKKKEK